jgi:hypothetical protein
MLSATLLRSFFSAASPTVPVGGSSIRRDRYVFFALVCCLSLATVSLSIGMASAQVPPAPYVPPAPILNPSSSLSRSRLRFRSRRGSRWDRSADMDPTYSVLARHQTRYSIRRAVCCTIPVDTGPLSAKPQLGRYVAGSIYWWKPTQLSQNGWRFPQRGRPAMSHPLVCLTDSDRSNPKTTTAAAAAAAAAAATASAASAASVATAPATSTPACAAAASAAASVSASPVGSNPDAPCSGAFLVEEIEGRQADVRDFLLGEDYRRSFLCWLVACRSGGGECAGRN